MTEAKSYGKAVAVIFKQIKPGDYRKLAAESNDATTGGGARDFRFPSAPFAPVLEIFFPKIVGTSANGGNIRRGSLVWSNALLNERYEVDLHPPTDARPTEARISRINSLEPLQACPEPDDLIPLFVIFTLDKDGTFRCDFANTNELNEHWHTDIVRPILESLDVIQGNNSAMGWVDFNTGMEYLHQ